MDVFDLIEEYRSLNFSEILDYDRLNEYAIVHHSAVIEGSTLTENETRILLEEDITPKGKPLIHSLMVKDHFAALQYVLLEAAHPMPLSLSFFRNINSLVMKTTGALHNTVLGQVDETKGEFRKGNVSAGPTYFPSYDKVELLTAELVKKLDYKIDQVRSDQGKLELAFASHFCLVSIHPFYDGNGRTSRLLMNYLQRRFNLPMSIVFKEDKSEYFTALQSSQKMDDIKPFNDFMYDQYTQLLRNEINELKKITNPNSLSKGFSFLF